MKLDLKVGNYVRTKYGYIAKVVNINNFREPGLKYGIEASYFKDIMFVGDDDIIKASDKLIDLIEVGDYVNSREVVDLFYNANNKILGVETRGSVDYVNEEIKSIVTKECFEQMSYKVGG